MSQIIPVRTGEELNAQILEECLRAEIPSLPAGTLHIEQFGTGASNLTYALRIGEWEAVLRRPPLGPVAPKAHDMEREYKILKDLNPLFPLAPKPYFFSGDDSVTGSTFFVMERRHGVLVDTELPENSECTVEIGHSLSEVMVDTLVKLHDVPYKGTALETLSKPEGFMERQVRGWIGRYHKAKTDEIFEVELLTKWLQANLPVSGEPAVIHYDFKFNNALFSQNLKEMTGLFDWEMTTIGDPLADLGAAMSYWMEKDDPEPLKKGMGRPSITTNGKFYTRDQFIESYARKSGRDVTNIHYYTTFATFKLAVICQQIYYRYKKGQTNDQRFARFGPFTQILIQHALRMAHKES
ncbi:phosphotransferase family protein [Bacillus sp. V2I10]|uniref:phosphotransferase family protein n=1 Tax=Bacillus sp. V2I10 TaxID=3042276 RepID=UPI0027853462|nr:phosphotransferase family protein [Bacillus sp. V2I10]MDQ0860309.1 aminoglycoside phosphotransferase (APT) family kinase protein [Bacillus sp. V2I10]